MIYSRILDSSNLAVLLFISFLMLLSGCGESAPEPEIVELSDEETAEEFRQIRDSVSISLLDGLEVNLWASEKFLGDPVGLDIDNHGRALVAVTNRRARSGPMFDIRSHTEWMTESLSWETVEERREFLYRQFSRERSDENSWLEDKNEDGNHDWRDLTVDKEEIYRIEDLSGNGAANRSELFLRDFHEVDSDIIGTVLYHNGVVFAGVAPDLWRIRDTTGDGMGDEKESISHGYGVHISFGGHGMSGLRTGPDGRIYWSVGDIGLSKVDRDGKRWHYPHEGVIVRSEPDGSNFEVFASGLRNTHEFDFDKYGNLISVDNDGDHSGEFERVVYLTDGSDSGWRIHWQFGKYDQPDNNAYKVWMDEEYYMPRFEGQAAHILPPIARYHAGPSGLVYNPGTALDGRWENHFFVSHFTGTPVRSAVNAFSLEPSGASFELNNDERLMEGVLVTSMNFGPDGALYMSDWVEGWVTNDKGRIWRMDSTDGTDSGIRAETKELLADDFSRRSETELVSLLHHEDMRVRQKAQFELVDIEAASALLSAVSNSNHRLARIHGVWGLAQLGRRDSDVVKPLIGFLDDGDPEIRAQAAKMLGDVRYEPSAGDLIALLEDEQARVRFFATEALGRIGYRPALDPITGMIEANNDEDVYLRHAGAIALERIGDGEAVAALAGHSSRAVRVAAVVALKRLGHPGAARFLEDEDEYVVTNAARAISDDAFIEEAMPALAKMLDQDRFVNEPLIRRAINANLHGGTSADANRLAGFTLRDDVDEGLWVEALNALSVWPEPSPLDRVTGRYVGPVVNDETFAQRAMEGVYRQLLEHESAGLRIAAIEALGGLKMEHAASGIIALLGDDDSGQVRMAALAALWEMEYDGIEEVMELALEDEDRAVRMNALQLIPRLGLSVEISVELIESVLETGSAEERQAALRTLADFDVPAAHSVLGRQLELLMRGELLPEIQLDLILAVEESGSEELLEVLARYEAAKDEGPVSRFREALYGGNAVEGRRIFYQGAAAECIRCHAVDGEGGEVGPDLTDVGTKRSREQLLESLVDPSARLTPGFGVVTVRLNSGETIRGALADETGEQITVTSGDQTWQIDKEDIAERVNSPSAMPAMGELLSRRQLRDLVEYMSTLDGVE